MIFTYDHRGEARVGVVGGHAKKDVLVHVGRREEGGAGLKNHYDYLPASAVTRVGAP